MKSKYDLNDSNNNGRLRLLLAEDTLTIRALIFDVLESSEIEVIVAKDGAEALSLFCRHDFDVVVTDVRMPVLNGRLATKFMRLYEESNPELDPTPIIAISANTTEFDRKECYAAGANAFVSKPIDFKNLVNTIELLTEAVPHQPITVQQQQKLSRAIMTNLDEATFDRSNALKRLGGDESLLNQMVSLYQSDQQELLDSIRSALEVEDLKTAARHAHSLKGLAATIGGIEVARAASVFSDVVRQSKTFQSETLAGESGRRIVDALEQLVIANSELLKQLGSVCS